MKVIDAQVHLWSQAIVPPGGGHRQVQSFSAEELLAEMAEAGVDGALSPSAVRAGIRPRTRSRLEVVQRNIPTASPSWGSSRRSDRSNEQLIATWLAAARHAGHALGIRLWRPADRGEGRRLRLDLAGRREAPACRSRCKPATFSPKFRWIAERHPGLKLIIDHCGLKSGAKDEAALEHLDKLLLLARLPNVALKATGAPGYSTQPYPFRNLHDPLHRLFDAFGPDRFFWGTDITRMPCSYRQCVTFFTEELPWLKGADLEKVMGRGLAKWIGWDFKF